MLTNHCYKDIEDKWDSERHPKNKVADCCFDPNPDDPTCLDCCYDTWQIKLKDVNQQWQRVSEEATQFKKKLDFSIDRRARYRLWVSELDTAEDLTRLICHQLEVIVSQSGKLWYNSCKAVEAIEILFCMIRDFYKQVDYLQKRYDDLNICLTNNHDSALEKGKGILKYVDEYVAKLKIIINTRDEIIIAIMQAIRIANLIRNNISTQGCPCPDPDKPYDPCKDGGKLCPPCDKDNPFYGFRTIICEWYNDLQCDTECIPIDPCAEKEKEEHYGQQQQQQQQSRQQQQEAYHTNTSQETETEEEERARCCRLRPVIKFPICNDKYKLDILKWLEKEEKNVKEWSTEYKTYIKSRESLQACKDSLLKAINEVNPTERCKS